MKRWCARASQTALTLVWLWGPAACGDGSGSADVGHSGDDDDDDDDSTTEDPPDTDTGPEPIGWFEVGWGDGEYIPISDGAEFPIVRGGQGLEMFPMPLRGAEFYLPGNPTTWMDETGPLVDLEMDIEGFNDGPQGHFKRIANHTLTWIVHEDGTYESEYLPIIIPDGLDSAELEGTTAHLWVRLRPHEQPELVMELDVTVTVMSTPPE